MRRERVVFTRLAVGIAAALALVMGCGGGPDKATGTAGIRSIVVTPDSATLVAGATMTFTAQPENASGDTVEGVTMFWASADTTKVIVNQSGLVEARAPGTVQVAASAEGVTGFATVTVTPRPVASVTVTPNPASVPLNATATLTATLKDATGDTLAGQAVTWTTSDSTTVSVAPSTGQTEVVTGVKAGSATVTATSADGKIGTVVVTVTHPVSYIQVTPNPLNVRVPYTVQATAQAFDVNNTLLSGVIFTWTTKSTGTIASVNTTGLVTGVAPGSDSVYAAAGGKLGGTPATVRADSVRTVTVTPTAATIAVTQAETLTVTAVDSLGHPVAGVTVAWTSVPVARVSPTSGPTTIVTPQAADAGTNIVATAAAQGKTGQSTITVEQVAPGAPSSLTAAVSGSSIHLSWSPVAGTTDYEVFRGISSGGEGTTPIATPTGTSYADSPGPGTFYYVVEACGGAGCSGNSPEASATLPPAAPTGLTATPGTNQVTLSWNAVTGATAGYDVFRGTTAGGEGGTAIATGITATTYVDNSATAGSTYYYKVEACNNACSAQSNEASATPTLAAPAAPTALTATPGVNQVTLTWIGSSGASSYQVFRGTTAGGEGGTAIATNITTLSYVDNSATAGPTYYYKVEACNSGGCSAQGNEASAAPSLPAPGQPTVTQGTIGSGQLTVSWSPTAPPATYYNVSVSTSTGGPYTLLNPPQTTTTTSYTDTETATVMYYYVVQACNSNGCSTNSPEASGTAP